MLLKYSELTFRKKLTYGFTLILVLFTFVMVIYQSTLNSTINNYQNLLSTAVFVEIKSIEAHDVLGRCRGNERDFFLYRKNEHIDELEQNLQILKKITSDIFALTLKENYTEDAESARAALAGIKQYENAVKETVSAYEKKGLSEDSGLLKALAKAAFDLAEITSQHTFNDFYILYLKLVEAEREYQLFGSRTKRKEVEAFIHSFIVLCKKSPIWDTAKSELEELIAEYQKTFKAFTKNCRHADTNCPHFRKLQEASGSIRYLLDNMYLQNGRALLLEIKSGEKDYFLHPDETSKEATLKSIKNAIDSVNNSTMDIDFIYEMESYLIDYKKHFNNIVNINKEIFHLKTKMNELSVRLEELFEKLKYSAVKTAKTISKSSGERARKNAFQARVIGLFVIIGTILLGFFITRSITKPLNRAVEFANGIAEGNLEQTVNIEGTDEIGKLGKSMSVMVKNLINSKNEILKKNMAKTHMLEQVFVSTEKITVGSGDLADFSKSLMQGASEQNNLIEEINISLKEIETHTAKNADNASKANELVNNSLYAVNTGMDHMHKMISAMDNINAVGNEIVKIVKAIDDIAFQINILAINAAVEAARAGRHGKGFAVVASEVKNLATKSTDAVNETTTLIQDSIKTVQIGNQMTRENEKVLNDISESVGKTVSLVEEIAIQSKSQAMSISKISNDINLVNKVTKKNAKDAQKTFSSAEYFYLQAEALKKLLSDSEN